MSATRSDTAFTGPWPPVTFVDRPNPRWSHVITRWLRAKNGTCWYQTAALPPRPWLRMRSGPSPAVSNHNRSPSPTSRKPSVLGMLIRCGPFTVTIRDPRRRWPRSPKWFHLSLSRATGASERHVKPKRVIHFAHERHRQRGNVADQSCRTDRTDLFRLSLRRYWQPGLLRSEQHLKRVHRSHIRRHRDHCHDSRASPVGRIIRRIAAHDHHRADFALFGAEIRVE